MKAAPLSFNEAERLKLLQRLEILNTVSDDFFDDVTKAITLICDAPIAFVNLADSYRQWFKSQAETETCEISREIAFFTHTIFQDEMIVVPDTLKDVRFQDNPFVTGEPNIRFYAGAPLKFSFKNSIGTLCVIDYQPHVLDRKQMALFGLMARHVVALIKLRLSKLEDSRDFSEMVLAKQRLQYKKDLQEAIIDNEPESVHILSRDGEVLQINQAGLDILEVGSLNELRERKLIDYVLPEYRNTYASLLSDVFLGRQGIAEYKIVGACGTERWMESHAAPLNNPHGEVINLIAITRDVTEIKKSRQKLVLAARVFAEAQEGIMITDAKGTIVDINPAFCNITGYGREEIIGQNPRILHSGKQGPDFYAELWKTLAKTGNWKGEIWNRKKNGDLYAELISINALRDEAGNAINYVAQFLDITEVKANKALKGQSQPSSRV